jgi:hypothetical protein
VLLAFQLQQPLCYLRATLIKVSEVPTLTFGTV